MDFATLLLLLLALIAGSAVTALVLSRKKQPTEESPMLLFEQMIDSLRTEMREHSKNHLDVLQQSQAGIGQRLDTASRFFGGMETKMVKVEEATRQVLEIGKGVTDLQQILKAPKLRGNFSEQLLADLLAQMLPQDDFSMQYTFQSGERVDAVIKTKERLVPIDAKFPLENFQRVIAAKEESERKNWRKVFISDVRKHVDDISKKYILPAEGTFDFALMYIPAENVYYEIITRDISSESGSILEYALKKKVIPVSPNTFFAYLQTILLGLRGMQVEKRVGEILQEMGRLHKSLEGFRSDFMLIGKHLNDALSSYGKSEKRLIRLEDKMKSLDTTPEAIKERSLEELAPPVQ